MKYQGGHETFTDMQERLQRKAAEIVEQQLQDEEQLAANAENSDDEAEAALAAKRRA